MIIDLTKRKLITESWLKQFGNWNKTLLKYMYGDDVNMVADLGAHHLLGKMMGENEENADKVSFVIRGEHRDVKAYAQAIVAEKNYLDMYLNHGPEHLQTAKTREVLQQAVRRFESLTGITWPFKDEG
jgi:hypothetical protein